MGQSRSTTQAGGAPSTPELPPVWPAAAAELAPVAAELGVAAGTVLSAAAVAEITQKTLDALTHFARARVGSRADQVKQTLESAFPERTPAEIDPIVREELRRERVFQKRMAHRINRDLPKALQESDPDVRRDKVSKLLNREKRYVGQRIDAMHARSIARAEHLAVQEASPQGAYWWLSPYVHKHTPDCVALGHQFWPWSFLEEVHPPMHPGCPCELLTLNEAVDRGYMVPEQIPDPEKALKDGKKKLKDALDLEQALTPAQWADYLDELVEAARFDEMLHPRTRSGKWRWAGRVRPSADTVSHLQDRWAQLDRDLLPYAGRPNEPVARRIISEQKKVTRQIHHANLDKGGPEGIGKPGGARDVVVVGAGPAGLSAAIYGATEGLDTLMVDGNQEPGGQARLSSRIENVLGFPAGITGHDYATMGLEQAQRTGAETRFQTRVTAMDYDPKTGLKHLHLDDGSTIDARAVVIAGGVEFRKLNFPGADEKGIIYGDSKALKQACHGGPVVIVGGANSAGQAAVDAASSASHVTILVRKGHLSDGMSKYLVDQLESDPKVTILEDAEIASADTDGGSITLKDGRKVPCKALGLFIGSAPKTDWTGAEHDDHGFVTVGHGDTLETSIPGVFAAGDIRANSVHRVITAAGDGAAAIAETHTFLATLAKPALQEAEHTEADDVADRWLEAMDHLDRVQPYTGLANEGRPHGLEEARWQRRFEKGTKEGGRFQPRAGGIAHAIARALIPRLPETPLEKLARGRGDRHELAGRRVFVPEARRFDRRFGDQRFLSPAGTTEVERVVGSGAASAPGPLQIGRRNEAVVDLLHPEREQARHRATSRAHGAAQGHDPVEDGTPGASTDAGLRRAGWHPTVATPDEGGTRITYAGPNGSSTVDVHYASDGTVSSHTLHRHRAIRPRAPLNHQPQSWQEFSDDFQNYARTTALAHGRHAYTTTVREDDTMADHAAETMFDGSTAFGEDFRPALERINDVRNAGGIPDDQDLRQWYATVQSSTHEALHAAAPTQPEDYGDQANANLEEALAEELSHVEAVRRLTTMGDQDTVDWRADHPLDSKALGTYLPEREALRQILDTANVAPQDREAFLTRLLLDTPADLRVHELELASSDTTGSVRQLLEHPPEPSGLPILAPPAEPTHRPTGLEVRKRAVQIGDEVTVKDQGTGFVAAIRRTFGRPVATVETPAGTLYAVMPGQITRHVATPHRAAGSAAPKVEWDDLDCHEGDHLRWDGGEGTLSRVLSPTLLDVRLADGNRVYISKEQATQINLRSEGPQETAVPLQGGGGAPATLEAHAEALKRFNAHGQPLVPTKLLVPTEAPSARPNAPENAAPLTVKRRADGRLDVTKGSEHVYWARQQGVSHLPVFAGGPQASLFFPDEFRGRHQAPPSPVEAMKEAGVDPALAFAPADAGPMHATRAEYRMRGAAAILEQHAQVKDAVLKLPKESQAKEKLIASLTTGDVARAQHEFVDTPLGDLEILSGIEVANHPVSGQAHTNMLARTLTMGSTSAMGDFRHELGHALRASWGGKGGPSAHTPLTSYVAARHADALARVKANIAAGLPKPKSEPEWEQKLGLISPRGLDSWDEDFAEQYRGYHRAVYRQTHPEAGDHDPDALDKYRQNNPGWADLWDAWYTAQLAGRPKARENKPVWSEDELVSRLMANDGRKNLPIPGWPWGDKGKKKKQEAGGWQSQVYGGMKGGDYGKGKGYKPKPYSPKGTKDDTGSVTLGDPAGGTTGARWAKGADGQEYVVKTYNGDADRVATELLGNAIYRKLGVAVPEAGLLNFKGKSALASKLVPGKTQRWTTPSPELADGFMADALLGNWDVIGLDQDNVLWDDGKPTRVDQGGVLEFRAQGGTKDFGPVPSEVWTMARPGGQALGTMQLTPEVKKAGAAHIAATLTPDTIDDLVDAAPFKDAKMRARVRENLKARVAWMAGYANGLEGEPAMPEGKIADKLLAKNPLRLYPEQSAALEGYLAGWSGPVGEHLRSKKTRDKASGEVNFVVREMDSLLNAARAPEAFVAYVAMPYDPQPGDSLLERSYLAATTDKAAAEKSGHAVRIIVPKGARVIYTPAYLDQLEGTPPPEPRLIFDRGLRAKVVAPGEAVVSR